MKTKPDEGGASEVGRASARPERTESGLKPALLSDDESPGVPGFRTWRGVYAFVFVAFAVVVGALALFAHVFA